MLSLSKTLVPTALVLAFSQSAVAAPSLERVYFCGLAAVNTKNGTEIQRAEQSMNDSVAISQKRLVRGEIRIFEVDSDTLESRMTRIPSMLRITHIGAQLRARAAANAKDNCIYSFNIYNNRGKTVESIFGDYEGASLGVSVLATLGVKYLSKGDGHYIVAQDSAFYGIGVDLGSYIKYELRAGAKQTDQVEVLNPRTGNKSTITREQALKAVLR